AGNISPLSADFPITVDTTDPVAPIVTAINDDSGAITNDGITNDNTLIFTGTAEPNTSVEVFINGVSIGSTTANGSGNWSYDHSGTTLGDASYVITSQATDAAGNISPLSTDFPFTVDTTDPAAPVVTSISDDSGAITNDGITNDNTLIFTGTAEPNASVEVFIDGVSIGFVTADGSGDWSYDHTGITLDDASYLISSQATDAAGNISLVSADFPITVDTTDPIATAVTSISDDSGA
ncbi:Ig-like domain-containing protein, partial [Cellulophaga sp. F20128]|uniref:Ig-like domain-containing protein n=1 Tax=Cellulophaga sp. F20128 TaxID=2926413 RepID=UPI001FF2B9D7